MVGKDTATFASLKFKKSVSCFGDASKSQVNITITQQTHLHVAGRRTENNYCVTVCLLGLNMKGNYSHTHFNIYAQDFFTTSTWHVTSQHFLPWAASLHRGHMGDHSLSRRTEQTAARSGRQGVGDGWRWIIDAQHTDHKQNTKAHIGINVPDACSHTHTGARTHLSLLSLAHPKPFTVFFLRDVVVTETDAAVRLRGETSRHQGKRNLPRTYYFHWQWH